MRTSELIGPALDWAVAKCEDADPKWAGFSIHKGQVWSNARIYSPSTNWVQGGPIIERERIELVCATSPRVWSAFITHYAQNRPHWTTQGNDPAPLIAAMRCYVAFKLGNEIGTRQTEITLKE